MSPERNLHLLFRIACAMCFIGHGAFGIITKQVWCNYFAVFGIGETMAYQLMPFVGIADIVCGILFIVFPIRLVAGWLIIWGLFTASLRPMSGEPFAEFLERAGNYGAPLILLLLSGPMGSWFKRMEPQQLTEEKLKQVTLWLRIIGCTLLLGHGWLNIIIKESPIIGALEIIGALAILIKPSKEIVLILFIWKMLSEVLYPVYPFFEWVERGGSYAVLLGLYLIMRPTYTYAMKKDLSFLILAFLLLNVSCSTSTLSADEVERLLKNNKAYPRVIEARLFINEERTAMKLRDTDLEEQGYLTVQVTHTIEDIGQSLVHFTDKAAPYLLAKPDSVESIEVQLVKIGEEVFSKVNSISYSADGQRADAIFEVAIEDLTPFSDLSEYKMPTKQYRKTSFTRNAEGWQWDKKIKNVDATP